MKKYFIHKFILTVIMTMTVFSCTEDFLELVPRDQLTSETIFSDESGADMFLNDIYKYLPSPEGPVMAGNIGGRVVCSFEGWSDNVVSAYLSDLSWTKSISRDYSPDDNMNFVQSAPFVYDDVFGYIRKCNLFIEKVNENQDHFSEEWKIKRIAEVRYIRAMHYHNAWMAYGGLPLITKTLDRNEQGDEIFYPRSTSEETYRFIINELKDIKGNLPNEIGKGRVTQGAVLALEAWVHLFRGKYVEAASTAKEIMDLSIYGLFSDYNEQFMGENNNNKESIFAFQQIASVFRSSRSEFFGPKEFYGGYQTMQPTQSLVDSYRMSNGMPIDHENSGYNPLRPYENREKRFYQSIIYDGAEFAGKRFETFDLYREKDARYHSGYARRKGINPALRGNFQAENANYPFFRYAEILLIYAEAKIEQNQIDQSVVDAIDQVRIRGYLPSLSDTYGVAGISLSQNRLREIVRTERRVELAMECKRYWDLIRWRIAEDVLNEPKYGMDKINDIYERVIIHTCEFDPSKHYLFPLYRNWLESNPVMATQNGGPDGWINGQNPGY
jgi:hypothetical protein